MEAQGAWLARGIHSTARLLARAVACIEPDGTAFFGKLAAVYLVISRGRDRWAHPVRGGFALCSVSVFCRFLSEEDDQRRLFCYQETQLLKC